MPQTESQKNFSPPLMLEPARIKQRRHCVGAVLQPYDEIHCAVIATVQAPQARNTPRAGAARNWRAAVV
jgi:hypothetical protein